MKYDPMKYGKHVFSKHIGADERVEQFISFRDYKWEMRSCRLGAVPGTLLATYKRIR